MRVTLRIIDGPHEGGKVFLRDGQVVQVGRAEWADFAFPRDGYMSGVHFSLECDRRTCRLRDLNSSNGTSVNGKELSEAILENGDKVFTGQTLFEVRIEDVAPDLAPLPAASPEVQGADAAGTGDPAPPPSIQATMPVVAGESPIDATLKKGMNDDPGRPYQAALEDPDPAVRRQALLAAAWTGRSWVLPYCRKLSRQPAVDDWHATLILAILGRPRDLEQILAVGRAEELGPQRFQALGAFGHPGVVRLLLDAMRSDDAAVAAASGDAYVKITAAEIDTFQTAGSPSEEGAAADAAPLSGAELATADWRRRKEQFSQGTRYSCGFDLSRPPGEEILRQLDMQSCWEASLRGHFEGTWRPSFLDREQPSPWVD